MKHKYLSCIYDMAPASKSEEAERQKEGHMGVCLLVSQLQKQGLNFAGTSDEMVFGCSTQQGLVAQPGLTAFSRAGLPLKLGAT